jgi:hypothetical protein
MRMVQDSPEQALQIASLITDDQLRSNLQRQALRFWSDRDYTAALKWAISSSMPIEAAADALLDASVVRDNSQFERAMSAASAMPHEKMRIRTELTVFRKWAAFDAAAAINWLRRSALSPETKEMFLAFQNPPR